MDVVGAITAGLLAISVVAAFLTVRESRIGRRDEATARRNEFERDRLLDRERRLFRVAERIVDFADVWGGVEREGDDYEFRQRIVQMRLQAAYDAVGYSLPATRKLVTGENMLGAYIDLAQQALEEVGSNLNGLAGASLVPPPSEYFVPKRRWPRRWWPRRSIQT